MDEELIKANLFLYAVVPLVEELYNEEKKKSKKLESLKTIFQIETKDGPSVYLQFADGKLEIKEGRHNTPNINLIFKDLKSMNGTLGGGKISLPKIKMKISQLLNLLKIFKMLNQLNILKPEVEVTEPEKRKLKLKLMLYTVTSGMARLSQLDDYVKNEIRNIVNRVIQWHIKPDGPSAYVRIDNGKIEAFKGIYEKRPRPITTINFKDIDSAYEIFTGKIDTAEAWKKELVEIVGSPEYSVKATSLMMRVNDYLNPPK